MRVIFFYFICITFFERPRIRYTYIRVIIYYIYTRTVSWLQLSHVNNMINNVKKIDTRRCEVVCIKIL